MKEIRSPFNNEFQRYDFSKPNKERSPSVMKANQNTLVKGLHGNPNPTNGQVSIDAKRPWQNDPSTCITWKSGGVTDEERIANLQFSLRNEVNAHVKVIKERDELLATCKGALVAISHPVTFTRKRSDREHVRAYKILSADCDSARGWLQLAIRKYDALHLSNPESTTAPLSTKTS